MTWGFNLACSEDQCDNNTAEVLAAKTNMPSISVYQDDSEFFEYDDTLDLDTDLVVDNGLEASLRSSSCRLVHEGRCERVSNEL